MKKILKKSKGFTLVELLIVIIIIGILAGMMMLATGSATDKANATKIVSNLRNVKAATIMYYADHNEWPAENVQANSSSDITKYLDQSVSNDYKYVSSDGKLWIQASTQSDGIKKILTSMASNSSISVDGNGVRMPIK